MLPARFEMTGSEGPLVFPVPELRVIAPRRGTPDSAAPRVVGMRSILGRDVLKLFRLSLDLVEELVELEEK